MVMFGGEIWTLSKGDKLKFKIWERKILRKIYGPKQEQGIWKIRTNREVKELYRDMDMVEDIKRRILEWIGHVLRMDYKRVARRI
mgnify:CR=1 FL=1